MRMRFTTEMFIERARQIHGAKYDYSETSYVRSIDKVVIICSKHGRFEQIAGNHINPLIKSGCPYCAHKKIFKGENDLASQASWAADQWDYDKNDLGPDEVFVSSGKKYWFRCDLGHSYQMSLNNKVSKHYGCPYCSGQRLLTGFNDLETRCPDIAVNWSSRNEKSPSEYSYGSGSRVWWICPDCGFEYVREINVQIKGHGCPICKKSLLEKFVSRMLDKYNVEYVEHKTFSWMGSQHLDFYLPKLNCAIECQGRQHFSAIDYFGGKDAFEVTLERDLRKLLLCEKHNVSIFYFSNDDRIPDEWFYPVERDIDTLISKCLECA